MLRFRGVCGACVCPHPQPLSRTRERGAVLRIAPLFPLFHAVGEGVRG
jgi:hypothetical protein